MNALNPWTPFERRLIARLGTGQACKPDGAGGARVGRIKVPSESVRRLLSAGVVTAGETGFALTEAGQRLTRRLAAAGDEGFQAQHQLRAIADREIGGERHSVMINLAESPLSRLAARAGQDGAPLLTRDQIIAGERLRNDYEIAAMGPGVTMRYDGVPGRSGKTELTPSERQMAARARVRKALDAVGPHLSDILLRICCLTEGLEQAERTLKWPRRSAKLVLTIALDRLVAHYDGKRPPG